MKKRMKNSKKILIVSLVLLSVVAIFLIYNFGFKSSNEALAVVPLDTQIGECTGGWTTFSISNVVINSDKSRIRVYGVTKGSECMNIQLSASQLDSYLNSQGLDATRDVTGSIKLLEYTKTFPIDRTGRDYYSLMNNLVVDGTQLWSTSLQSCTDKGYPDAVYVYRPFPLFNIRCVLPGVNGIEGSFSSARSYGNFNVQFTLDGQSSYLSREQQSINIGNHHIEWTGNLENFDQIYSPQYDARLIGSKWDLVEKGTYSQLDSRLNLFFTCMEQHKITLEGIFGFVADGSYDTCKSQFDSLSNALYGSKLSKYISDNSNLIYDADTDSNALYVALKATPFPTFILDLDAQSVGITTLEGKPDITQCIPLQSDLKSGQNKQVTFTVKNLANVNNVEFYGSVNCNQGITAYLPNFYMNANQEKVITTEIIPSNPNQADLAFSCTLTVTDLKSGNSDSCLFVGDIAYESGIICQPNSLTCDSKLENVLKCSSDGKNTEISKECEYGCEFVSGTAKCKEEEAPQSTYCESCDAYAKKLLLSWIFPSTSCTKKLFQNTVFCVGAIVRLVAVPLLFILAFVLGLITLPILLKNKYPWLSWILSTVFAFLIAVLTYFIFYAGLVAFGVYVAVRIILRFTPLKKFIK